MDVLRFKNALKANLLSLTNAYSSVIRRAAFRAESANFKITPGAPIPVGDKPKGTYVSEYPHILKPVIFSDSIFVFTSDESEESLIELCEFCAATYEDFLRMNLALRGGIARGEAIVHHEDSLFMGQAIVDAYELECSVDLTGIVMTAGLGCEASMEAPVTFKKKKDQEEAKIEKLHVPLIRSKLHDGKQYVRNFQIIRAQAGANYLQRYKNSEPVVAAMLKIDPELLKPIRS